MLKRRCWICGSFLSLRKGQYRTNISWDHLITKKEMKETKRKPRQGTNLLPACQECNNNRGHKLLTDEQRLKARYIFIAAVAYELGI